MGICNCCCRQREGAMHALEHKMLQIVSNIERTTRAQATLTTVQRWSGAILWLWPLIVGIVAIVVQRFIPYETLAKQARNTPVLLAVIAVVATPVLAALASDRVAAALGVRWQRSIAASSTAKATLLERMKKELPMHEALVLLSKYDPNGNHAALIEAPPHLLQQMDDLQARLNEAEGDKAGLLTVVDHLLGQLGRAAPGGWSQARSLVEPITPALTRHRHSLPASANLLLGEAGSSIDGRIMSYLVATPARPAAASSDATPGVVASQVAADLAAAAPAPMEPVPEVTPEAGKED